MRMSPKSPLAPPAAALIALLAFLALAPGAQADDFTCTKLLRYPDISSDAVVFVYAGDLWRAPLAGGQAARLTAHEGLELFPKFSPDGKWIAFTGQYDGDEQVYVIPAEGGVPKQLTYYPNPQPSAPRRGYDAQVMGWTADGRQILFRSGRGGNGVDSLTALYTVSIDGGLPEKLPMPSAGAGDIAADGQRVVYSPLFRDFRHWKRYSGGWAQHLLVYDFHSNTYPRVPTTERTDRDPMWVGQEVYFLSDRDGTLNLYRFAGGEVQQCTRHDDWDLRWASSDGRSQIVYEMGGELYRYDTATGQESRIPIHVPHDGLAARPERINAADFIESFELAPGGKRMVFTARGDLFTVPAEKGNTRNLTRTSGVHERGGVWSKDGRRIAMISDSTGEDQIWLADPLGKDPPRQISDSMTSMLHNLTWSPKGNAVSFHDADNRLWILTEPENGAGMWKPTEVVRDPNGGDLNVSWAPDGSRLAYTMEGENYYRTVWIYDLATGEHHRVTDPMFDFRSPAWDLNGDWLYMIGQCEFYPQISTIEWNFAANRMDGLFAVALRKDVENRFGPESDEADTEDEKDEEKAEDQKPEDDKAKDDKAKDDKAKEDDAKKFAVDYDGIEGRIVRLPMTSENYEGLLAADGFLYCFQAGANFYGRDSYAKTKLTAFNLEKKKSSVFAEDVTSYTISPDGKSIGYKSGESYRVAAVGEKASDDDKQISTGDMTMDRDPGEEWNEIFNEVWRRYRDYFYVKNMHGYDWNKIGAQYRSLLPYVAHRSDLTYVLTEMISELSSGHTYVDNGDYVVPKRLKSGLAGAEFALDRAVGRYKIAKIYPGQNSEEKYRSPLTEVGVDVKVGDYVLAIDGEELLGGDNPYRLLRGKAKRTVTWRVASKSDGSDAREITYRPIENEANLRYLDFTLRAAKRVEEATGGRAGYLHIPDMGANGGYEFLKWYYPQLRKEGLIIDDRNNGGGNISSWILARLNQRMLGTRFGSMRDTPTTYPSFACNAHLVCLINETSASDGDIFPYYFRENKLGPIIGKRSWGGVVGITSLGPLTDGGTVYVPLSATNDKTGQYVIEGHGVDPDIEIWQNPLDQAAGIDDQLERGIIEIMKKIEAEPRTLPKRPADPVKSQDKPALAP